LLKFKFSQIVTQRTLNKKHFFNYILYNNNFILRVRVLLVKDFRFFTIKTTYKYTSNFVDTLKFKTNFAKSITLQVQYMNVIFYEYYSNSRRK